MRWYILIFFIMAFCNFKEIKNDSLKNFSKELSRKAVIEVLSKEGNLANQKFSIENQTKIDLNNNNIDDYVYLVEVDKDTIVDRLLVIQRDIQHVNIFNKIIPASKTGYNNYVHLDTINNDITIFTELTISRPVSADYLSFTILDNNIILDSIISYIRDYEVDGITEPFLLRGRLKTKSDFGIIKLEELQLLDQSDEFRNLDYDFSNFNFETVTFQKLEQFFYSFHKLAIEKYKVKDIVWLRNNLSRDFILRNLIPIPIYSKNLNIYNDFGYLFEQSGKFDDAVFLLKKVIEKDPTRTVAYINLGDAYWGMEEKTKAKEAYIKYIDLMKKSGKQAKIPKRVIERTNG